MARHRRLIVTAYIKMWPRTVFDVTNGRKGKSINPEIRDLLAQPGVYILYRDDQPYYVGKASRRLITRLRSHAVKPRDKYYNFWNFFSAFVIPHKKHIPEIEGILIASMPTDNSVVMRIKRIHLPAHIAEILRNQRLIRGTSQQVQIT